MEVETPPIIVFIFYYLADFSRSLKLLKLTDRCIMSLTTFHSNNYFGGYEACNPKCISNENQDIKRNFMHIPPPLFYFLHCICGRCHGIVVASATVIHSLSTSTFSFMFCQIVCIPNTTSTGRVFFSSKNRNERSSFLFEILEFEWNLFVHVYILHLLTERTRHDQDMDALREQRVEINKMENAFM